MLMANVVVCRCLLKSSLDNGEVLVSLCYKPHLERLAVGIFEGKNLNKLDAYSPPGTQSVLQVCVQLPTHADDVALPAFAPCRMPRCRAPSSSRSISLSGLAHSSKPALASLLVWDR